MLKAALIGYGYWGPNIARNLARSQDYELVAICDKDPGQLAKARLVFGDSVAYVADYRAVVDDAAIDMCAVALRDAIGQEVARAVLRSKKHLFMEKPMATTLSDALLLQKLAEASGVHIHVDHILVFHPIIRKIKAIIESGELGELISFESNRANLGPHIKRDMNAMWDLAVHDLAILDYLCNGQPVRKVECMGQKQFGQQEIITYLTAKYDGFVAMIKSSWFSPLKERRITISGSKKMIVFDDLQESEKLMVYDKGVELDAALFREYGSYEAKTRSGDLYVPYIEQEDSLLNSLGHFAGCIREGRPSIAGPEQAIRVLQILETANADLAE
ncbi:MAG: Gfo/Idh/MocA family oxidoreductase [Ruminococcaceae bacterium]|nr:Gfo/Idh/MocA family oxidoreductase [Oscillospiraceae bacterium]